MAMISNNQTPEIPIVPLQTAERKALWFTTNPGLEKVALEEFLRRAQAAGVSVTTTEAKPFALAGYARLESPEAIADLLRLGGQMRSVHHLLEPLYTFPLPTERPLEVLYDIVRRLDISALRGAASFRVSTVRSGDHDFTSLDIQRVAGAALQAHYGTAVDLTGYEVEVRVDVFARRGLVGLKHTRQALSLRRQHPYCPSAALKPNVAYAMLNLTQFESPPSALLDPFCGSGTILLEAASVWPETALYGSDWDQQAIAGARRNAAAAGLADHLTLCQTDARHLASTFPDLRVQAIVTNPPYGVRLGRGINFFAFYRRFLEQAAAVLEPGGRLVILVLKRGAFNRVLRKCKHFIVRQVRIVEIGGLYPAAFVLERH